MGLANEMKKMSEEILASYKKRAEEYQQRLKENEELVFEVQKTLDGFKKNHLEMAANLHTNAATLRAGLTRGEVARLNSFSDLMNGIRESISTIQKEVGDIQRSTADLLMAFSASRGEKSAQARADSEKQTLDREKQNQDRLKDFDNLMENIHADINRSKAEVKEILTGAENLISKYAGERVEMSVNLHNDLNTNLEERVAFTRALLKTFHDRMTEISNENQEMAEALKKKLLQSRQDLSAGEVKRMKDFDQSMAEIRHRVGEIQSSIASLITNLSSDRMQAAAEWQGLSDAIAQIKDGNTSAPKSAPAAQIQNVEAKKEEEKIEIEPVKEKKQEIDFPKEMSLEEKIIMYVNEHPEGVKVSEMEEPLGEQRMRIGYASKKLLDEGKLTKLENAYFPKGKSEKKKK